MLEDVQEIYNIIRQNQFCDHVYALTFYQETFCMPTAITGKDGLLYVTFAFHRLLWTLLLPCFYLSLVLTAILFLFIMGVRAWLQMKRKTRRPQDGRPAVAFFHPYCNAGGGGERVLWCALRALQNRSAISALLEWAIYLTRHLWVSDK